MRLQPTPQRFEDKFYLRELSRANRVEFVIGDFVVKMRPPIAIACQLA
jgi:hypothetical protein